MREQEYPEDPAFRKILDTEICCKKLLFFSGKIRYYTFIAVGEIIGICFAVSIFIYLFSTL